MSRPISSGTILSNGPFYFSLLNQDHKRVRQDTCAATAAVVACGRGLSSSSFVSSSDSIVAIKAN